MLSVILAWLTGVPGAVWGAVTGFLNFFGGLTLQGKVTLLGAVLVACLGMGYGWQIHQKNHAIATLTAELAAMTKAVEDRDAALTRMQADNAALRAHLTLQNAAVEGLQHHAVQAQFAAQQRLAAALAARPAPEPHVAPGHQELNRWLDGRLARSH